MGGKKFNFENMLSGRDKADKPNNREGEEQKAQLKKRKEYINNKGHKNKNSEEPSGENNVINIPVRKGKKEPFTFHICNRDVELIRAICDYENISQRKFIETFIDELINKKGESIKQALKEYMESDEQVKDSILDQ